MRFLFQLPHVPEQVGPVALRGGVRVPVREPGHGVLPLDAGRRARTRWCRCARARPRWRASGTRGLAYHPWSLGFAPAEEDTAALTVDVNEATREQLKALDRAQEQAPESKVGGVAVWMNGDAPPDCCGDPARFVAQLSAMPFGLDFGDNGRGYLFRCQHQPEHFRFLSQGA